MQRVVEYLREAAEAERLAAKVEAGELRTKLLDLAANWRRLAEEEAASRRLDEPRSFGAS